MLCKARDQRVNSAQQVGQWCRELLAHRLHPSTVPLPAALLTQTTRKPMGWSQLTIVLSVFLIGLALSAGALWWAEIDSSKQLANPLNATPSQSDSNESAPSSTTTEAPSPSSAREIEAEIDSIERELQLLEQQLLTPKP